MSRHFFITGTSSGIGEALARHLLEKQLGSVTGISRRKPAIETPDYTHIHADLSDPQTLKNWQFELPESATHAYLINNAGSIGDITRVGFADDGSLEQVTTLNLTAPMILSNRFLKQWQDDKKLVVLNISSGAANYPIDAWAAYCASKAGLDHWCRTVHLEQQQTGRNIPVFSVAPGIVDTEMQAVIRSSDPKQFSRHADFVALKEGDELIDPRHVATLLTSVLLHPEKEHEPVFTLRNRIGDL